MTMRRDLRTDWGYYTQQVVGYREHFLEVVVVDGGGGGGGGKIQTL